MQMYSPYICAHKSTRAHVYRHPLYICENRYSDIHVQVFPNPWVHRYAYTYSTYSLIHTHAYGYMAMCTQPLYTHVYTC